jgi:hypothetical protein
VQRGWHDDGDGTLMDTSTLGAMAVGIDVNGDGWRWMEMDSNGDVATLTPSH